MTDPTCSDCGAPIAPLNDCYCPQYSEMTFPFAPLEKYTFPGGYEIFAVMDDGDILCANCVNDPSNPVHMGGENDGWRIEGIDTTEGFEFHQTESCAHCGNLIK